VESKDIVEIANLGSPPDAIKHVCTIVFHFFFNSKDAGWDVVKIRLLKISGLTDKLKSLDMAGITKVQADRARKCISDLKKSLGNPEGDELLEAIKKKSGPSMNLFKWCVATDSCAEIFREVEPKRRKAREMEIKKEKAEAQLAEIQHNLAVLTESLAKLN